MTCKFTVIPVNCGDAFLLEKCEEKIIVDGGNNKEQLRKYLKYDTGIDEIDIAVCTHNDADHSKGILGLLEPCCDIKVKEVWLPGSWTYQLPLLLQCPDLFMKDVFCEYYNEKILTDNYLKQITCAEMRQGELQEEKNFKLLDVVHQSPHLYPCLFSLIPHIKLPYASTYLAKLFHLAETIRNITIAAVSKGCLVRFFEHFDFGSHTCPWGGKNYLKPVNSIELTTLVTKPMTPLQYLRFLSRINRQSLVFYSPEAQTPGVFFCADSNLRFPILYPKPTRSIIVTAPHHGADSCKESYNKIATWAGNNIPIWVRSDHKCNRRPCKEYIALSNKYCTMCRVASSPSKHKNNFSPKEAIVFTANSGQWISANTACKCR